MDKLKKEFASKLLKVKAIKLQPNDPFTWASGWKSPFYCDNRKTLSFPELRNYVKLELVHAILEQFPEADAVAGVWLEVPSHRVPWLLTSCTCLSFTFVLNQRITVCRTSSKVSSILRLRLLL